MLKPSSYLVLQDFLFIKKLIQRINFKIKERFNTFHDFKIQFLNSHITFLSNL